VFYFFSSGNPNLDDGIFLRFAAVNLAIYSLSPRRLEQITLPLNLPILY